MEVKKQIDKDRNHFEKGKKSVSLLRLFTFILALSYLILVGVGVMKFGSWGLVLLMFLALHVILFILATILLGMSLRSPRKESLHRVILLFVFSAVACYDPNWRLFAILPLLLAGLLWIESKRLKARNK